MYKKIILLFNIFLFVIAILISINIIKVFTKDTMAYSTDSFLAATFSQVPLSLQEQTQEYNYYANNILRGNLFGVAGGFVQELGGIIKADFDELNIALPKTSLNLLLRGTIVSGPYTSFAIIEDKASRIQGLYKIGDTISDAKIIGIYRKKIILERGAKQEALFIDGDCSKEEVCNKVNKTKAQGGRIVAIGTTSVRSLESAASHSKGEELQPYSGDTDIFITPGYQFKIVDALLTNFHLPESTLLMLVSAFAGYENIMNAYQHAVDEKYRFFSYGDAMFLTRQ